jgi:Tol biopolymer transport system component
MTPERWNQIQAMCREALNRDPAERAAFIRESCGNDEDLRFEVESLLSKEPRAKDFLEQQAPSGLDLTERTLTLGAQQLGPYRIDRLLGEGGMGQVFLAHDTRLGRNVAIKIAKEEFSERFEREARMISLPNHPHICTLFDVGPNYLVMELVEGDMLSTRLRRRKLSLEETLRYGAQIADALAEAHAKGIVHRDLKPANVMLSKNGVKVLDFGIAKARGDTNITRMHGKLGTPDYMAPEQHAGTECDARTDIYALGLVLAEMATGKRRSREGIPPQLAHVIDRCLEEDPNNRWQAAKDIHAVLQWIAGMPQAKPVHDSTRWTKLSITGLIALILLAGVASYWTSRHSDLPVVRFMFMPPFKSTQVDVAVSPDGNQVALASATGDSSVWLRSVDSLTLRELSGTPRAFRPSWFYDGRAIAFIAQTEGLAGLGSFSELRRLDFADGRYLVQKTLSPVSLAGAAINKDGVILYQPELTGTPLFRLKIGKTPVPATRLNVARNEITHRYPEFLPDGRHFLYWVWSAVAENTGICVGSLDPDEKLPACPLMRTWREARYAEPGYLLVLDGSRLVAQRFDPTRLLLVGQPRLLREEVARHWSATGWAMFSVSSNGVLAYQQAVPQPGAHFVWRDRSGNPLRTMDAPLGTLEAALGPNERQLVASGEDENTVETLWFLDLERATASRLTASHASDYGAVWSPDAQRIVFSSNRTGVYDLYVRNPNGSGQEELLLQSPHSKHPSSWSQDRRFLIYEEDDSRTGLDIWVLPFDGDRKPFPFLKTEFNESRGVLSPVPDSEGRFWIAYQSDEAGTFEVYLRPFRTGSHDSPAGAKLRVSTGGGIRPRWRKDGRELFYISEGKVVAVAVKLGPVPTLGVPHLLFDAPSAIRFGYEVTADGKNFLLLEPNGEDLPARINVVLNWPAELK